MANVIDFVPKAKGTEYIFLQNAMRKMTDDEALEFSSTYNSRRRECILMMMLCFLGFLGIAGIQRFAINHISKGILYFSIVCLFWIGAVCAYLFDANHTYVTAFCVIALGLSWVITVVDMVSLRPSTEEYNIGIAKNVLAKMNYVLS